MMKFLWTLLLVFSLSCSTRSTHPTILRQIPELVERAGLSVVRVTHPGDDGHTDVCAGFVVSATRGIAVTAAHCVPTDPTVTFLVDDTPSEIIFKNDSFVAVSIIPMTKPPLTLGNEPKVGDMAVSLGWGYDRWTGMVRHVAQLVGGDIILDGPFIPGMSGGPTVNEAGLVVGLNQASNPAVGVMCGVGELKDFLAEVRRATVK